MLASSISALLDAAGETAASHRRRGVKTPTKSRGLHCCRAGEAACCLSRGKEACVRAWCCLSPASSCVCKSPSPTQSNQRQPEVHLWSSISDALSASISSPTGPPAPASPDTIDSFVADPVATNPAPMPMGIPRRASTSTSPLPLPSSSPFLSPSSSSSSSDPCVSLAAL